MTPEQFTDLKALLTNMLTPVRDLALYQLEQAKQPLPPAPSTRSILAEQTGRAEALKRAPVAAGPGNRAPYRVGAVPSANLNDPELPKMVSWAVYGRDGISIGFIGTKDEADIEASRLNSEADNRHFRAVQLDDERWEVRDSNEISTGFIGSQGDANAEVARLNAPPS